VRLLACKGFILAACLLILAAGSVLSAAVHAEYSASESDIKAAYLYKLGAFVFWPETSSAAQQNLSICVLGNAQVGASLQQMLGSGRKEAGRTLFVHYLQTLPDLLPAQQPQAQVQLGADEQHNRQRCDILFISQSEQLRLRAALEWARQQQILTVSDIDKFALQGGMIEFYTRRNKVQMMLNLAAARAGGIKFRAQLLSFAKVIGLKDEAE
jgi:hypothetical protein